MQLKVETLPVSALPGSNPLTLDHNEGKAEAFFRCPSLKANELTHRAELVELLRAQNPESTVALESLAAGAQVIVTGQQVGLFGGPLFTPFKVASAVRRAADETKAGRTHVPLFWLATEDHDFDEINHTVFPARNELWKLSYTEKPAVAVPVGGVVLRDSIRALVEEAGELIGYSDALDALEAAYVPGKTLAQAFAEFYRKALGGEVLILDPASRAFHKIGAPVFKAAIEQADELHALLIERNEQLQTAGYGAQVNVGEHSSLLFLLNAKTGARESLKRTAPTTEETQGYWVAGRERYSSDELLAILAEAPERISPSALLRPLYQDWLLPTTAYFGGAAEIAYFAQSAVLYERILGRVTPILPRLGGTIVEPAVAELLKRYELEPGRVFGKSEDELAQQLGARALPIEGKRKLAAAGNALDGELTELVAWMKAVDLGLGQSGERAASKMRYQMNRLRRLAARFSLEKEAAIGRHAGSIVRALYPEGHLQERVIGAAYYFARHGFGLMDEFVANAEGDGHKIFWL